MPRKIFTAVIVAVIVLWGAWGMAQKTETSTSDPLVYNPQAVESVKGIVVKIIPADLSDGKPEPVYLSLKTDTGTLSIFLGPNWFVAQQPVKIAILDRLEITGARTTIEGKPGIIAARVVKGDKTMQLRDETGKANWRRLE